MTSVESCLPGKPLECRSLCQQGLVVFTILNKVCHTHANADSQSSILNPSISIYGGPLAKCQLKHPWTSRNSLQVVLLASSVLKRHSYLI